MKVFYVGAPGGMGGANTEMGHTIRIWRKQGIEVGVIPTWNIDDQTRSSLEQIGCEVHNIQQIAKIESVPGLAGSPVMSMCNQHFFAIYGQLKAMGCKTVWSNAMTFMFDHEMKGFNQHGCCAAHHFQSEFQRAELEPILTSYGYKPEQGHLIRGAFDFQSVPFAPREHAAGKDFVVGRLSRPDLDKWSSNHWPILWKVPYAQRRAICMGWTPETQRKVGQPPPWAECLKPQQIPVTEFLGRCHVMLGLNGGARENWPRIGLEAMAAGVPVVAQNLWGWKDMIRHRETGLLFDTDEECEYYLGKLAMEEDFRQSLIKRAYKHVQTIADPDVIGKQWKELFASLGA